MADVAVVGSANLDVVVTMQHRPLPGETIVGTGYQEAAGGKGRNQAVAAARLASSAFVGAVGSDAAGTRIEESLVMAGVGVAHLARVDAPTGRAFVSLTPDGENSIVVLPLANGRLSVEHVGRALDSIHPAIVLTQLEVPDTVTLFVAEWCEQNGARLVLNPSPVRAIPSHILALADPVIANVHEAATLLGVEEGSLSLYDLALGLAERAKSVVLTAGSRGALVVQGGDVTEVPGHVVAVRDTTGAGDAFAGTLVGGLAQGVDLAGAAGAANQEAACVVQLARSDR